MWKYNQTPESDELMHYGILGMKWGVRRSEAQLARARKKAAKKEPDHEDYTKAHTPKSIRAMGNTELNERNKRLQAENQYKKLTKKTNKGKKLVDVFIGTANTIGGLATAYVAYEKFGKQLIEKAGDYVVSSIKIGKLTD